MRARLDPKSGETYFPAFELNKPISGGGVGEVIESGSDTFKKGDLIFSLLPWKEIVAIESSNLKNVVKLQSKDHPSYALSVLGMPGMTAYFGLLHICEPKEGETIVVSGAGGAVGSLVGQIGKIKGCRVVGIAGSDEKLKILKELGFDVGINYKTTKDLSADLKKACPNGIDVYFDNVGGPISDAVTLQLNLNARISFCGAISQYNGEHQTGPRFNWLMITKGIKAQGFIVNREFQKHYSSAIPEMTKWLQEGKLKMHETITEGLGNIGQAFVDMMNGKNIGKQVVKL